MLVCSGFGNVIPRCRDTASIDLSLSQSGEVISGMLLRRVASADFGGVQRNERLTVRPFQVVVSTLEGIGYPCLRLTQRLADLDLSQPGPLNFRYERFPVHAEISHKRYFLSIAIAVFLFNTIAI